MTLIVNHAPATIVLKLVCIFCFVWAEATFHMKCPHALRAENAGSYTLWVGVTVAKLSDVGGCSEEAFFKHDDGHGVLLFPVTIPFSNKKEQATQISKSVERKYK